MKIDFENAVLYLRIQMGHLRDQAVVSGVIDCTHVMPPLAKLAEDIVRELIGDNDELSGSAAFRIRLTFGDERMDTDGFWRTDLGQVYAWRHGYHGSAVPFLRAAAILGMSRQGVSYLVRRSLLPLSPLNAAAITPQGVRDYLRRTPLEVG